MLPLTWLASLCILQTIISLISPKPIIVDPCYDSYVDIKPNEAGTIIYRGTGRLTECSVDLRFDGTGAGSNRFYFTNLNESSAGCGTDGELKFQNTTYCVGETLGGLFLELADGASNMLSFNTLDVGNLTMEFFGAIVPCNTEHQVIPGENNNLAVVMVARSDPEMDELPSDCTVRIEGLSWRQFTTSTQIIAGAESIDGIEINKNVYYSVRNGWTQLKSQNKIPYIMTPVNVKGDFVFKFQVNHCKDPPPKLADADTTNPAGPWYLGDAVKYKCNPGYLLSVPGMSVMCISVNDVDSEWSVLEEGECEPSNVTSEELTPKAESLVTVEDLTTAQTVTVNSTISFDRLSAEDGSAGTGMIIGIVAPIIAIALIIPLTVYIRKQHKPKPEEESAEGASKEEGKSENQIIESNDGKLETNSASFKDKKRSKNKSHVPNEKIEPTTADEKDTPPLVPDVKKLLDPGSKGNDGAADTKSIKSSKKSKTKTKKKNNASTGKKK